jgi:hypothetical protein
MHAPVGSLEKDCPPVLMSTLASELGLDTSNMRRYIIKSGFTMFKVRTVESQNQLTLALTPEDAQAVRDLRKSQGFVYGDVVDYELTCVDDAQGTFYLLLLVPEISAKRIKGGFTSSLISRLGAHKTTCPTLEIAKTWTCKRSWEPALLDVINAFGGCTRVGQEVYDCDDIDALVGRIDLFFSLFSAKT